LSDSPHYRSRVWVVKQWSWSISRTSRKTFCLSPEEEEYPS